MRCDFCGVPVFIGNLKKHMRADGHSPGSAGVLTRFGSATLPAKEHKHLFCKQFANPDKNGHTSILVIDSLVTRHSQCSFFHTGYKGSGIQVRT